MRAILLTGLLLASPIAAGEVLFEDDFKGGLKDGWSWVREDAKGWRTTEAGLELRVLPGNMWGPPNDAKNVLVRPVPDAGEDGVTITVKVRNEPTEQYEQVNLVWYYDDSNMVKLGLEQVDKTLCVVMGREERDRTRTISVIPKGTPALELRLTVESGKIRGEYRPDGAGEWAKAGECPLPAGEKPHASLQAYQGPAEAERWAKITGFRIERVKSE
jgi:regulation of enolase protein 1 (concanavalin A-like superfamily)